MAVAGAALIIGGAILIAEGGSLYYLLAGAALGATAIGVAWGKTLRPSARSACCSRDAPLGAVGSRPRRLGAGPAPGRSGRARSLPADPGGAEGDGIGDRPGGSAHRSWRSSLTIAASPGSSPDRDRRTAEAQRRSRRAGAVDGEWRNWGRTLGGDRFSPLSQINTGNVGKLKLAWQFKSDVPISASTASRPRRSRSNGKLYLCLDRNVIVALDQETGQQVWRFDPQARSHRPVRRHLPRRLLLRGAAAGAPNARSGSCSACSDGRLMAVDADDRAALPLASATTARSTSSKGWARSRRASSSRPRRRPSSAASPSSAAG